ncbi:MAG TPA: ABC transporter permease [Acidothermaceae bacterium]|jgi:D-xylose transport system permease protein
MSQDISGDQSVAPKATDIPETPTATATPAARGDFSGDVGAATLKQAVTNYFARVKGGEVGGLPAFLGLIVLLVVFTMTTKVFMTKGNMANVVTQAGPIIFIAMGLVFVLLLGEIDLAAGTAAGLSSAGMAIAVNHHGDIASQLKGGMFGAYIVCMVVGLLIAAWQRMWWAVAFVAFGIVILTTHLGSNQILAMLLAVTTGTAIGVLTGFLVARVKIPSFVVTLALFLAWQGVLIQFLGAGNAIPTQQFKHINAIENSNISPAWGWVLLVVFVGGYGVFVIYRSLRRRAEQLPAAPMSVLGTQLVVLLVLGALAVYFLNENRNPNKGNPIRGVPWVVPLILVVFVAMTLLLSKTSFGRHLYAAGGNAEAARRAGIDVPRMRIAAFAISTTLAGIGGVVLASKQGGVPADAGAGNTLLFAVGAAVIGGTSLFGGRGRIRDAVLGGLVIAIIPNGLQLHPGIGASYQYVITGGYLLVGAAVDALSRARQQA